MVTAAEDLSKYRFCTGADLRPLHPDEPCPVLFRDLGAIAQERFLEGTLPRLAGPLSPVLFARTVDYREPYVDHEDIGRLVFLRPRELQPWFSGIGHVYVARATRFVARDAVGYVPPGTSLARVACLAKDLHDAHGLRDALGSNAYDEACAHARHRLSRLNAELADSEVRAAPLRHAFQSRDAERRQSARTEMSRVGISEGDLCTAWHHLPRERRAAFAAALQGIDLARLRSR